MSSISAINPPGPSGGIPLPIWIGVVLILIVMGAIVAVRRRR